ncbi:hypothetical protein NAEGRDRAFT_80561 [Naegleria gruberi]|uniref:RGS domain-containing protein n=1 Tax=Naegleria gruberi TaxID=5762 RepID=D2VMM7_NAEGR|nr:uncharacterized protein NAEGRDRAFT_80561 [Naegleria gruberi]EFC41761.1 hypothetical protein NAEGRDRAFT_80561 [Naegleria gruberi]|eukprot:XP_002674505.1 hypothetical protein NAEGRDRAFT_80561 [Naegleria gruberi strain NEG-M]
MPTVQLEEIELQESGQTTSTQIVQKVDEVALQSTSNNVATSNLLAVHNDYTQLSSVGSSVGSSVMKFQQQESAIITAGKANSTTGLSVGESRSAISKRTATSLKTSKTKTSRTSTSVRLRTCCGTIELNCVRLISLIGMIVNIVAFFVILAMTIQTFVITSAPVVDMLVNFGDVQIAYQETTSSVYKGVILQSNDTAFSWYSNKDRLIDSLNQLLTLVPAGTANGILNGSSDAQSLPILATHKAIIDTVVYLGDYNASSAMMQRNMSKSTERWDRGMKYFMETVSNLAQSQYNSIISSMTTNLVVISVCLVVAIPVCIGIFVMTIKRERELSEKLKHANIVLLMNTMADPFFRDLFGDYCNLHKPSTYSRFKLLEKLQHIKMSIRKLITLSLHRDDANSNSSYGNLDSQISSSSLSSTTTIGEGEEEVSIRRKLYKHLVELNDEFVEPQTVAASKKKNLNNNIHLDDFFNIRHMIEDFEPITTTNNHHGGNDNNHKESTPLTPHTPFFQFQSSLLTASVAGSSAGSSLLGGSTLLGAGNQQAGTSSSSFGSVMNGGNNNRKKQTKLEVYSNLVDQAQGYVGEGLLPIHDKFKKQLQFPANTRKLMLKNYRIMFKQELETLLQTK